LPPLNDDVAWAEVEDTCVNVEVGPLEARPTDKTKYVVPIKAIAIRATIAMMINLEDRVLRLPCPPVPPLRGLGGGVPLF
jgi:hypothetical protein